MARIATKRAAGTSTAATPPPSPYIAPPAVLVPFLRFLDPNHVYLVHLDKQAPAQKRSIFVVPVLMNLAFVAGLLWRVWIAVPTYLHIILPVLGFSYGANESLAGAPLSVLVDVITRRAGLFFMDFALLRFVLPWPRDFFIGAPASPFTWRWRLGFQDEEVVVRKSRRWSEDLPEGWLTEGNRDTNAIYTDRIMPSIDPTWLRTKTSYLMMDKSWDLDFAHMIYAHQLIDEQKATLADFRTMVLVHTKTWGWLVWQVYQLDGEQGSEKSRQKVLMFKEKLTAMGKESLFYRWIELIQFESSQPGGFTLQRQKTAMQEARKLFEDQGVDFEAFWESVGGMEGMTL